MKRIVTTVFAISLIFILAACNTAKGNGNVTVEEHDVSDFNRIDFSGTGELFVSVGETESLTVSTDSNLHNALEISVRDETLHIGTKNGTIINNPTELVYTITVIDLESLEISGSGEVTIESVNTENFDLESSGSSAVILETVDVESLNVDISGSGSIRVAGEAESVNFEISGSGRANAFDLTTDSATIDLSGSGMVEITANNELSGSISGSGQIQYRGDASVNVDVSGSGSVNADN